MSGTDMEYFVVLEHGDKKVAPATPENRLIYMKNIIFIGDFKSCLSLGQMIVPSE